MSETRDPDRDQPLPRAGSLPVQRILIGALVERRDHGIRKYGRPLETGNGRDVLKDLWEEQLDSLTYLTQLRLENGEEVATLSPQAARDTAVTEALRLVESGPRAMTCDQCKATTGVPCRGILASHQVRISVHHEALLRALRRAAAAEGDIALVESIMGGGAA